MKKAKDITTNLSGFILILFSGVLFNFGGIPYPRIILLPPVVGVSILVGGIALLIGKGWNEQMQMFEMVTLKKHHK